MSKRVKLRVERDIVEQAVVEFDIDEDEYAEWLDGQTGATDEDVIEFLMAHRDWPQNIVDQMANVTRWREQYRDYELMAEPAEVRSTDTTKDPRERAEYLAASNADAAMGDWRPANETGEDG